MVTVDHYTSMVKTPEHPVDARELEQVKLFTREEMQKLGIIHPAMRDQSVVNSFRNLRTSLLARMEKYNSCIIVSSIVSGGGASFVASNLAAAFTFDHQKTAMLIDCNFKKPALATKLRVQEEYGLKDYITGDVDDVADIVYPTGIPRLRVIPSGTTDSDLIEFFTGEKMYSFLQEVKSRYANRIIIIDCPPILESADTKILAELSDHVLLVVPYRGVTENVVNRTLSSIERSKVVGMVLNK